VRGQGGPSDYAETYNGCRITRLVRSVETGGTVQLTADFIAQTADDRAAPTAALSYESSRTLAYHPEVTNITFNSVQLDNIVSATLTIDKKLARTPELGSLTTGAPVQDALGEVTLEVRVRYYSNVPQIALIAETVAAGSMTTTDGTFSIVDSFPALQVVSVSDPVSGPGMIEQTIMFRCLSDGSDGPVTTVFTNNVAP